MVDNGSVTIGFYAVDVAGNMAFKQVSILKDTSGGLNPGVVAFIIIISVVGGVALVGVGYFYLKKRRDSN